MTGPAQKHKPKPTMMTEKPPLQSDLWLWWATQLIDYGGTLMMCFSQVVWEVPWVARLWISSGVPLWVNVVKLILLQGYVTFSLFFLKERLHFWVLGRRAARDKTEPLNRSNWMQVLWTIAMAQVYNAVLASRDWFRNPTDFGTLRFWVEAYSHLYAMLILRDAFLMYPFHGLFHRSGTIYKMFHKTHHRTVKNTTGMHAFQFGNPIDFFVEHLGAYAVLLVAQFLTGREMGIHWFALTAVYSFDVSLHSVNPFSCHFFNPLLDWVFRPNVCHQLHHACADGHKTGDGGYIISIPLWHWDPKNRRADMDKYNKVFRTDFSCT